jgi:target of rapamycin complex subunit LST8
MLLPEQGNVFVWSLRQGDEGTQLVPMTQFSAHKEYITRILLSPDVKKLATCSADHTARIWSVPLTDPDSPEIPIMTNGNGVNGNGVHATHATQPQALTNGDAESKPFPLEATLTGHQRWVWDCAFSADSAYLVTACSDHYARLWELGSQTVIRQYNGHHRGAVCVALNDYSEAR